MSLGAKKNISERSELRQKLFNKFHVMLYDEMNRLGMKYVEHGETFMISESEYKGLKVNIRIDIT